MKDSVDYRIGPGMTSLLMIFFVLCMAALAILTLQSVQVESVLNARTADATGAYYEAAVQVERQLADIDAKLAEARTAFDRARAIRPNGPEALDGLRRVSAAERRS